MEWSPDIVHVFFVYSHDITNKTAQAMVENVFLAGWKMLEYFDKFNFRNRNTLEHSIIS